MPSTQSEESSYQSLIELLNKGQYDDCVRGCMNHIDEFGDSAKIWVLTGSALGADNKPKQARSALLCALKIDPHNENAQVNYVTSCLHAGYKEDALKALQEFASDMTDDCLAFKMAPSLAEALEVGVLQSTDVSPKIWIRIENILDSIEEELDQINDYSELTSASQTRSKSNVIQFPIKNPDLHVHMKKPKPVAHFILENGEFRSATLYIEQNTFQVKGFETFLASPPDFDEPYGEMALIENPKDLAEFLFAGSPPDSISFLKLARRDWERNGSDFYLFESFCELDKRMNGKQLVHGHNFETENVHFRSEALWDVNMHDVQYPFTSSADYEGYRRLDELWSAPYLGEIIFKELKKEIKRISRTQKKAS